MMITLGRLAIFLFPILLTGCFTTACPPPGKDQPCGGDPCYYKLHVKNIVPDSTGYKVTGLLPRTSNPTYDFHVSKADGDKLHDAAKDPTLVYPFKYTCGSKDHLGLYPGRIEHFVRP